MHTRVLFVDFITAFGGVQRVMANMIPELMRYVDVTYIDALGDAISQAVYGEARIPLARLQLWPRRQVLGFEGPHLHKVAVLATWGPAYLLYVVRLASYARQGGFQVLYTNSTKGLLVAASASVLAGRLPVVYHCHGLEKPPKAGSVYARAMRACRAVIAVSHDVKMKLVAGGIPEDLVHVVYNGVVRKQLEVEASRVDTDVTDISRIPEPKCLVACNLQKGKGVHVAIEATRVLKSRGHLVHLVIAGEVSRGGDSQYRDLLRDMVRTSGLEGQVHFLGWRSDLPAVIRACDVLLVPSLVQESFGMVAAEAMALGKPVIASRIGGLPEVVQDGRTGFLFEPGNAAELADRIWKLVTDTCAYAEFSHEAQRWVDSQFSVQYQAREISHIVCQVGAEASHVGLRVRRRKSNAVQPDGSATGEQTEGGKTP